MGFKFDSTISLKEMLERCERGGATEIKRILPEQRGLTEVKIGVRPGKAQERSHQTRAHGMCERARVGRIPDHTAGYGRPRKDFKSRTSYVETGGSNPPTTFAANHTERQEEFK